MGMLEEDYLNTVPAVPEFRFTEERRASQTLTIEQTMWIKVGQAKYLNVERVPGRAPVNTECQERVFRKLVLS